jgi:diaminohydroxyphosphoribosylaminopyrimidine deaminase / 5-amino-6-(5-phosphoribosylamino)uracil reductase
VLGIQNVQDTVIDNTLYMDRACRVAARGLGIVAPNPSVGCLILDKNGRLVAISRTQDGGRPHAESVALAIAGHAAKGGVAFVTLEPCAHEGTTPSCARLLVEAGIKSVVIGVSDPDPRTAGRGEALLRKAGLYVVVLNHEGAFHVTQGFMCRLIRHRPFVTLKIAVTQNGYMRTPANSSPAITGTTVKNRVHLMRAEHDGLITGIGTVLEDNPALTCRLPGMQDMSPKVYILDRKARFQAGSQLDRMGTEILSLEPAQLKLAFNKVLTDLDAKTVLEYLAGQGINRLMIEAGPILSRHFLASGFVDEIVMFKAPHDVIADETMVKHGDLDYMQFNEVIKGFELKVEEQLDKDLMCLWRRKDI